MAEYAWIAQKVKVANRDSATKSSAEHLLHRKKGLKDKAIKILNSKLEVIFDAVTFSQNVYPVIENKPNVPKIVDK